MRRARWARQYGGALCGVAVGVLLALSQIAFAQIASPSIMAVVLFANALLGALFGRALTLVSVMMQVEWTPGAPRIAEVAWSPPPPPLAYPAPSQRISTTEQAPVFRTARIYGTADLLHLLRAAHLPADAPIQSFPYHAPETLRAAVIQS